jgi:hypothetical protein
MPVCNNSPKGVIVEDIVRLIESISELVARQDRTHCRRRPAATAAPQNDLVSQGFEKDQSQKRTSPDCTGSPIPEAKGKKQEAKGKKQEVERRRREGGEKAIAGKASIGGCRSWGCSWVEKMRGDNGGRAVGWMWQPVWLVFDMAGKNHGHLTLPATTL